MERLALKNGGLEQCVFLGNTLYFPVKLEDASWESPDLQTLPRRIQVLFFFIQAMTKNYNHVLHKVI